MSCTVHPCHPVLRIRIRCLFDPDPGFGMDVIGSGINIPDLQHCCHLGVSYFEGGGKLSAGGIVYNNV